MEAGALLIDGENERHRDAPAMVICGRRHGEVGESTVYGSAKRLRAWDKACAECSLRKEVTPTGRNSADRRMQADAWELYAEGVGSIFLATHDGGFATCARGPHERGVYVVGIGSQKCQVSRKLRQACDEYREV